jgi:hypothetical protein
MEPGVPSGGAATNSAKSTPTLANSNLAGSSDEEDSADEESHHWEVEDVVNHEWSPQHNQHRFYVKWKGFPSSQNSWVQQKDFDDVAILKRYWKKANKGAAKAVAPWAAVQADAKKALASFSEAGKKVWMKKKSMSQKEAHEDICGKQEVGSYRSQPGYGRRVQARAPTRRRSSAILDDLCFQPQVWLGGV